MKFHVLNVIIDGVLDACEVFFLKEHAFDAANDYCQRLGLTYNSDPVFDEFVDGWVIAEAHKYFVSIVLRPINQSPMDIPESNRAFLDKLNGFADKPQIKNDVITDPLILNIALNEKSLLENRTLPAGFDLDNKPILMGDVYDNPENVKNTFDLTQEQKWALTIARIKKINPQSEYLKEVKERTDRGLKFMNARVEALQKHYDDILDNWKLKKLTDNLYR